MPKMTNRQHAWAEAAHQEAQRGNEVSAGLFALLALPNDGERVGHNCVEHSLGFSRDGRRGFKCGICKTVVKWVDPEPSP